MITQVTFNDFVDAFKSHNREENFSYAGLQALFDYASEWQDGNGNPWELDVIEICCDFTEYETATEAAAAYGRWCYEDEAPALQWLENQTIVINFDGGVIVANF